LISCAIHPYLTLAGAPPRILRSVSHARRVRVRHLEVRLPCAGGVGRRGRAAMQPCRHRGGGLDIVVEGFGELGALLLVHSHGLRSVGAIGAIGAVGATVGATWAGGGR
jgi:hypothetical protein